MPMPEDERGSRARSACRAPDAMGAQRLPPPRGQAVPPQAAHPPEPLPVRVPLFRTDRPHPARMYDYYLGGKDNFAIDREAAETALAAAPEIREMARHNRGFLRRAVAFAARSGVGQFLDIGAGLPTAGDTYDYARTGSRDVRVVYVDNDPMVLAHARALLARPGGVASVVGGDLREPEAMLGTPELGDVLDFARPVAVVLTAVVHYLSEEDDPGRILATLMGALAPGSLMILSHTTGDVNSDSAHAAADAYQTASTSMTLRSHKEVAELFDGLEVVEPGIVQVPFWRPDRHPRTGSDRMWMYAGVGRKP
ncbi:SAM-dependent methyltransferase [Streptomycetaceae bacterium NBC_01309]